MICRYLLLVPLLCLVTVTSTAQELKVNKPYPRGLEKGLSFEMSLEGFENRFEYNTEYEFLQENSFRKEIRFIPNLKKIKEVILYFDKDGRQPLYEMIFVFHDTAEAEKAARALYGPPNFDGTEWRMRHKSMKLWCWIYKNKLVLVSDTENTEWAESFE
jgi:hypothetical protein